MKYIFYYYDQYTYRAKVRTRNIPLNDLFDYLYSEGQYYFNRLDYWIRLSEDESDPRKVIIWSKLNIKEALTYKSFDTYENFLDYLDRYHEYGRKRFAEMPAMRMFRDNYEKLKQQMEDIHNRKFKYLIMREHDNGYVDILEKDELSEEDIAIMNREHTIYQNYVKRWNEYIKAHPEKRSQVWRSPADDEYESDFALYDPVDEQGVD